MAPLEAILPRTVDSRTNSRLNHSEKQLLSMYSSVDPNSAYDGCQTCNNCGSGDCASCCSSSD